MQDWTSGYVSEIGYTYGYYNELNPLKAKVAFLFAGFEEPAGGDIHCELGFGQGISTNIHAAASASTWYANDFNPAQVSFAQALQEKSGSNANMSEESFEDFCNRKDLPTFSSIGLHGIWSWISEKNRENIVKFIKSKLAVGGVLYISYNTMPGWSSFVPIRQLMTSHVQLMGASANGLVNNIDGALEFASKLFETNPDFLKANPMVSEKLKKLLSLDRNYLAHEYFNQDWQPMHFSEMQKWLERAKLDFACSANLIDHIDSINLKNDQIELLETINDKYLKETVKDFCTNQQFRRDYWVKGLRKLNAQERIDKIRKIKIILITSVNEIKYKILGTHGEITLNENIYKPIINCLINHEPKILYDIEREIIRENIKFDNFAQAIFILIALGNISVIQDEEKILKSKIQTDRLNKYIISKAAYNAEINFLASPVIGAGISVNRFQQLFLLGKENGKKFPKEWAEFAWMKIENLNQRIVANGVALGTSEENISELIKQAEDFEKNRLPILKVLGVV